MTRSWTAAAFLLLASGCSGGDGEKYDRFGNVDARLVTYPSFSPDPVFVGVGVFSLQHFQRRNWEDDGECRRIGHGDVLMVGEDEDRWLDAGGSFALEGPNGDLTMVLDEVGFYYNQGEASLWVPDAQFDFSTEGGEEVGAFSASIHTPGFFQLTTPPVSTAPVDIVIGTDLELAWISSGSDAPIFVSISQSDFDLVCHFDDDGSATVDTSALEDTGSGSVTISKSLVEETDATTDLDIFFSSGSAEFWLDTSITD